MMRPFDITLWKDLLKRKTISWHINEHNHFHFKAIWDFQIIISYPSWNNFYRIYRLFSLVKNYKEKICFHFSFHPVKRDERSIEVKMFRRKIGSIFQHHNILVQWLKININLTYPSITTSHMWCVYIFYMCMT